jgi:hypothetical protein
MSKIKKWKLLEEKDISPSSHFPLFKHAVKLPSGRIVDDYYISKMGDVSMVVAVTEGREVIFVKQYKHGAGEVIVELPAGRIGKGSSPLQEAKVELENETGYVGEKFEFLGSMYAEPSKDTFQTHGFLVKNARLEKKQKLDPNEEIDVILIRTNRVDGKIKNGLIKATDTIAILRLAQLKAPELFK